MTSSEPARHALYSRLEEMLGTEHAETLMTYLPQDRSDEVATKGDIASLEASTKTEIGRLEDRFERLEDRFDRLEDRFDRLEDLVRAQQRFYVATTVWSMTGLTAIFSFVVVMVG